MKQKFFSTGKFAKYCGVGHRTVLRWIKEGWIHSFTLPGRGDNRIPASEALRFMEEQGIPVPQELSSLCASTSTVMVADPDRKLFDQLESDSRLAACDLVHFDSPFRAGVQAAVSPPAVLVLHEDVLPEDGRIEVKDMFANTEVVAGLKNDIAKVAGDILEALDKK